MDITESNKHYHRKKEQRTKAYEREDGTNVTYGAKRGTKTIGWGEEDERQSRTEWKGPIEALILAERGIETANKMNFKKEWGDMWIQGIHFYARLEEGMVRIQSMTRDVLKSQVSRNPKVHNEFLECDGIVHCLCERARHEAISHVKEHSASVHERPYGILLELFESSHVRDLEDAMNLIVTCWYGKEEVFINDNDRPLEGCDSWKVGFYRLIGVLEKKKVLFMELIECIWHNMWKPFIGRKKSEWVRFGGSNSAHLTLPDCTPHTLNILRNPLCVHILEGHTLW